MSLNTDEGRGRCPYDPYQRNTAVIVGKATDVGFIRAGWYDQNL